MANLYPWLYISLKTDLGLLLNPRNTNIFYVQNASRVYKELNMPLIAFSKQNPSTPALLSAKGSIDLLNRFFISCNMSIRQFGFQFICSALNCENTRLEFFDFYAFLFFVHFCVVFWLIFKIFVVWILQLHSFRWYCYGRGRQ
jgi:hypothetical protein